MQALAEAWAADQLPAAEILRKVGGSPHTAAALCAALPPLTRKQMLTAWSEGVLPDTHKRAAHRNLLHIFNGVATPASPAEGIANARSPAPSPTGRQLQPISHLRRRITLLQEIGSVFDLSLGCEDASELAVLLSDAEPADLREVALRIGVTNCATDSIVQHFLDNCVFATAQPAAAKQARRGVPPSSQQHVAPARQRLPLPAAAPQGSSEDEDDGKSLGSTSESSSDDSDDTSSLDARPRRMAAPLAAAGAAPRAKSVSCPGFEVLRSRISLDTNEADEDAVLALAILEDAAGVPELAPGVEQLFEALAERRGSWKVKASSQPSGTFFAAAHSLSTTSTGAGGAAWSMSRPSYGFKQRKDVSAKSVTQYLVSNIKIDGIAGGEPEVEVTLSAQILGSFVRAGAVYGWAELWSCAGGRAVLDLWQPLLSMQVDVSMDKMKVTEELINAAGLVLSAMTLKFSLCDERGAKHVMALACALLAAIGALLDTLHDVPGAEAALVAEWIRGMDEQARLLLYLGQGFANKAAMAAKDAANKSALSQQSLPRTSKQQRPSSLSGATVARQDEPGRLVKAPKATRRDFSDDPASFTWCSACYSPSHSLWDCINLRERVTDLRARGGDVAELLQKLVTECEAKWKSKGRPFATAFGQKPGWTVKALSSKHAHKRKTDPTAARNASHSYSPASVPHTNQPSAMAHALISATPPEHRHRFETVHVLQQLDSFWGWSGDKAVIDWRGYAMWHIHTCQDEVCEAAQGLTANVAACPVLRVLLQIAVEGLNPAMWLNPQVEGPNQHKFVSIPLSADEEAFARAKHSEFERAGVVQRVSGRQASEWLRQGRRPSGGFVVRRWKAATSGEGETAAKRWVRDAPQQVRQFIAGNKHISPPTEAFQPKDRVVYNFKEINERSLPMPMTFYSLKSVLEHVQEDDWLAVLDIQDGFTAVPVAHEASSLFWVRTQGQRDVLMQRMPFGYALAPFIFCLMSGVLAKALRVALRRAQLSAFVYVDDVLLRFKASSQEEAQLVVEIAIEVFQDLGFRVNASKVEGPARSVQYLGFQMSLDNKHKHLALPPVKRYTYVMLLRMMGALIEQQGAHYEHSSLPKTALESLIGKLEHVATLLPMAGRRLGIFYLLKKSRAWQFTPTTGDVRLSTNHITAIDWFMSQLGSDPRISVPHQPESTDNEWNVFGASDASGEGGLGGFLVVRQAPVHIVANRSTKWSLRLPGTDTATELVGQSTALEIKAVLVAMEQARLLVGPQVLASTFRLSLAIDSQAAAFLCRKGYSTASAALNTLAGKVKQAARALGCDLTITWIPRENNWIADMLSHPEGDHSELDAVSLPHSVASMSQQDSMNQAYYVTQAPPDRGSPPAQCKTTPLISHTHATSHALCLYAVKASLRAVVRRNASIEQRHEARMRIDALATSTTLGYLRAVARVVKALPKDVPITFHSLASIFEDRIVNGTWASHNARAYISDTLSALMWCNFPRPPDMSGKRLDWLARALGKARASKGPRKRKRFSLARLRKICDTLRGAQQKQTASVVVAAVWLGFKAMLRTNELRGLQSKRIRFWPKNGALKHMKIRIKDKTHSHPNRRIVIPVVDEWAADAERFKERVLSLAPKQAILRQAEWRQMRRAFALNARTMGTMRPSGNTFWKEAGTRESFIVANGGWTQTSQIPAKHYTTISGRIADKLRKQAQRRISAVG